MSLITAEKIEAMFMDYLQHNINVAYENKILKTGKLLLVSKKSAVVSLLILDNSTNKNKNYEIPYPFGFHIYDNYIEFDYTFGSLCNNKEQTVTELERFVTKKPHRFLNKTLRIEITN